MNNRTDNNGKMNSGRACARGSHATMTTRKINRRTALLAAAIGAVFAADAGAISFQKGELSGSWDTTLSYGAAWRVEERDPDNVGKANNNPLVFTLPREEQIDAPGRWSVNSDDGNLAYDDGDLISHAFKVTSELGLDWRNYGAFFRVSGFYDFENTDRENIGDTAEELVGNDLTMLDAYVYGNFTPGGHNASLRVGRQVVSWGENTFIQGGVNVINPVDVSKLRIAGAELREAFLPVDSVHGSLDLTDNLTVEGLYLFEYEQIDPDPTGSYFSDNDFAVPDGDFVMLGFGLFDEQTPGLTIDRSPTRFASESGQYGMALRYFSPELNFTEFGLYYLNYHSRLPLISGISVTNISPESGTYFVEYPEDIEVFGASFNTMIGTWALQGELSYRPDEPLQLDDVELLFAALSPLNALIPAPNNRFFSQLGEFPAGTEIQGWRNFETSQIQFTLSKVIGPGNPFGADQWVVLGEVGAKKVFDMPDKSELRLNGPGTDLGGGPDITGGFFRNPLTQDGGFADSFSWGYRLVSRVDYSSVFGTSWNLSPFIGYNHDVNGTSPGPGGNFIDGRKQFTIGLGGNHQNTWAFDLSYTRFFSSPEFNTLHDRDFVSAAIKYSF